jgi:hypothetical protein
MRVICKSPTSGRFDLEMHGHSRYWHLLASDYDYGLGDYGILEIGNHRLAIMGPCGGRGEGRTLVATNASYAFGGGERTGFPSMKFVSEPKLTGSTCRFGVLSFTIVNGTMTVDGRTFDLLRDSQAIVLDGAGNIQRVCDIPRKFRVPLKWRELVTNESHIAPVVPIDNEE